MLPKKSYVVEVERVPDVFSDHCIKALAATAKLPPDADIKRFGDSIRVAAEIYARDARTPNDNVVRKSITELHRAAVRKDYEKVACLIEQLHPRTSDFLNHHGLHAAMPSPEVLLDEGTRDHACVTVAQLCQTGGGWIRGRKRPSGNRSQSWAWKLYAPNPTVHFKTREAEREFVTNLKLALLEATGNKPPRVVNPDQPGPFARMVRDCFKLVGASHADAVGCINELNKPRSRRRRS